MGGAYFVHANEHVVLGHDDIAQQHVELLAGRLLGSAMHGMAQAKRLFLIHVADIQAASGLHGIGIRILAMGTQMRHQLRIRRKVLFDSLLIMAVDDDDLVGAACQALLYDVLDNRLIHYGQHFLRNCFRGGQESRTQTCGGNQSFHKNLVSGLVTVPGPGIIDVFVIYRSGASHKSFGELPHKTPYI